MLKWQLLSRLLSGGFGVLFSTPETVLISDPFAALFRDSDIEAMSSGWDDGSATGYNHVLDDPSMGFTRFCHGSRIVGYEPGLFFAMATAQVRARGSGRTCRWWDRQAVAHSARRASVGSVDGPCS